MNHEPIAARPPTRLYRFRKLVRRNKLAFAALSVLAVALLIVSVGSSVAAWRVAGARRAEHGERQKAEVANRQLRQTVSLLELGQLYPLWLASMQATLLVVLGRPSSRSNQIVGFQSRLLQSPESGLPEVARHANP